MTESTPTPTDVQLVIRSQQGDHRAYTTLVSRYKTLVMAKVMLIVKDHHKAEDLTQEAFLNAYSALGKLREADKFLPWLLTIAANVSKRAQRNRGKWFSFQPLADDHREVADRVVTQHDVETQETMHRVLAEVEKLPVVYRQLLQLRMSKGYSSQELAEVLDASPQTIRKRLSRAHAMLRQQLKSIVDEGIASDELY